MALLDLVFIPLVFLTGHLIVNQVVKAYKIESQRTLLIRLFYYHILFSLLFGWYVTTFGGDSVGYWTKTTSSQTTWLSLHQTGTFFVLFLVYPFSQGLGLSFWAGTLIFSLFGFAGFIFIFLTLMKFTRFNPTLFGYKLFPMILFLPNMHFWSGGVGKDSVMFFALTLFIFSLTNPLKNVAGIALSFYLAYYIRPHIALLMVVGFGFSLLISTKGVSFFWRIIFFASSVYVFVLISPAVIEFIGLDEENVETFEDLSNVRSKNLSRGNVGSAIDIRDYSVPQKIITFLFRPLFFDAGNIFGFIVSLENLFYLLLTLAIMRFRNLKEILKMPMHLKAGLFVLGSTAFFMSSSLGNLGIIIRQKNMVMFMLVLMAVYLIGKAQEEFVVNSSIPSGETQPYAKAKIA